MNANKLKAALLTAFFSLSLALPATHIHAQGWVDTVGEGGLDDIASEAYNQSGEPDKTLPEIVANIIEVILGFIGVILVVLIMVAGFKYMTANGNDEKVQEAVKQIRNAIIGLLIILASWGLTVFITDTIVSKITS